MRKGTFTAAVVVAVVLLGVTWAPAARAETLRDHGRMMTLSKEDAQATMMLMMHLKHHPEALRDLKPAQIVKLLKGLERLARVPFVDHDRLFRFRVKLTLHLLDLQIQRLSRLAGERAPLGSRPGPRHGMDKPDHKMGAAPLDFPLFKVQKIDAFRFATPVGCQLNQSKIARQNAWKREIFVGPCQADDAGWHFNVWKVDP